ncbi:hypothetical protein M3Y99_00160700 [Aphelenchoides fujianensis]|nr:hypothetical protein M3Y99_00160700 [Aphelenchoides fujianensis]
MNSLVLSALFLVLFVAVLDAQPADPSGGGPFSQNPRFRAFLQNLPPEQREAMKQKARNFFGQLTPQQKSEMHQIFAAHRGDRPALKAAMQEWASRQGGSLPGAFQQFRQMREQMPGGGMMG